MRKKLFLVEFSWELINYSILPVSQLTRATHPSVFYLNKAVKVVYLCDKRSGNFIICWYISAFWFVQKNLARRNRGKLFRDNFSLEGFISSEQRCTGQRFMIIRIFCNAAYFFVFSAMLQISMHILQRYNLTRMFCNAASSL